MIDTQAVNKEYFVMTLFSDKSFYSKTFSLS